MSAEFCPLWAFLYYLSVSGIAELVDSELKKPDADRRYIPIWPDYDPDRGRGGFVIHFGGLCYPICIFYMYSTIVTHVFHDASEYTC